MRACLPKCWFWIAALASGLCLFGCSGSGRTIRISWPESMKIEGAALATGLCVSPDGAMLGLLTDHGSLVVLDETGGEPRGILQQTLPFSPLEKPASIEFTPDARNLLVYNSDYLARVEVADGSYRLFKTRALVSEPLRAAAAVSRDGRLRAVGFRHGGLEIYDVDTGERTAKLKGHGDVPRALVDRGLIAVPWVTVTKGTAMITSAAFSEDGGLLATGDSLGAIRLWSVSDGKLRADLAKKGLIVLRRVLWLGLSPDNQLLAAATAGDASETVTIYDLANQQKLLEIPNVTLSMRSASSALPSDSVAAFSRDSRFFFCPRDREVLMWDMGEKKLEKVLSGHEGDVVSIACMAHGRLCSIAADRTCRIWDVSTGKCSAVFVLLPKGQYIYFDLRGAVTRLRSSPDAGRYYRRL